jgi:hypothetical protein
MNCRPLTPEEAEELRDKHWPKCAHLFDTRLCCDGREHYYPCVVKGCNERQYFCKHLRNDRHCPALGEPAAPDWRNTLGQYETSPTGDDDK